MRVIEISAFGLENLKLTQRDTPKPGRGEVLLKMKAVSLNYRDYLMVKGQYNPRLKLPVIPLSDGVGEVIEVGGDVSLVKVGDRVSPIFAPKWIAGSPTLHDMRHTLGGPLDGTLCEYMLLHESAVVAVPSHLSDFEAATLPCAALTAFSALFVYGNVKPGDSVLILGTGGVSVFALQFAKMAGACVIVTSSSDEKLQHMKQLGADHLINYRDKPDWGKEVRRITNGRGVDNVIEVGGGGTLQQSIKAVRIEGTISLIGVLAGSSNDFNLLPVLMQNIKIQGILVGSRQAFEAMNRAISANQLKPMVNKVFSFEQSIEALQYLEAQKHSGKVCISISE